MADEPKYPVHTVIKAIEVIHYLMKINGNRGASISEINQSLGFGKSTIHRLLDTLSFYDWVEKDPDTNRYRLGWGIYKVGEVVPLQNQLLNIDQNYLLDLSNKTNAIVNLGVLTHGSTVIISKIENAGTRMNRNPGEYESVHATGLGKILISELDASQIQEILGNSTEMTAFTENTITNLKDLLIELQITRQRGYAIDNEEFCKGLICFAMPLRDYTQKIVAAISVSTQTDTMTEERKQFILENLRATSSKISRSLGYTK